MMTIILYLRIIYIRYVTIFFLEKLQNILQWDYIPFEVRIAFVFHV